MTAMAPKSMNRAMLSIQVARLACSFASSPTASKKTCGSVNAASGKHSSAMASKAGAPKVSARTTRFCA
jgi:hypothetical protein